MTKPWVVEFDRLIENKGKLIEKCSKGGRLDGKKEARGEALKGKSWIQRNQKSCARKTRVAEQNRG